MTRRLRTAVAVHTPKGTVWLSAGESPSADVAALITAPNAWDDDAAAPAVPTEPAPASEPSEPTPETEAPAEPPRSGRGSGADAWRAYAQATGLDIDSDMTRDEIIAAVDNH